MLALFLTAILPAEPVDRPADNAATVLLIEARRLTEAGKLDEAVATLQKVLDTVPDELVEFVQLDSRGKPGYRVAAAQAAQTALARLPAAGLKAYRSRVDGLAARRLAVALADRFSDAKLEALVQEFFAASPTEEALVELGRRAFDRGNLGAARHWWSRLVGFPGGKVPPALTAARLILTRHLDGDTEGARKELESFAETYPDIAGPLFDGKGKYADILKDWLNRPVVPVARAARPDWPTFAGDDSRGQPAGPLPIFWPDQPAWVQTIPAAKSIGRTPLEPSPDNPRALCFFPIIVGDRAYIADGKTLWAFDARTGKPSAPVPLSISGGVTLPNGTSARFTLSAAGGLLLARTGPAEFKPTDRPESEIACLSHEGRKLWSVKPPQAADTTTLWEGAPVVAGGRLYAGWWRGSGADARSGVACLGPVAANAAPEVIWSREVGKADGPVAGVRARADLLTRAGGLILICTHAGQVAAFDERTGKPVWEYRYPSTDRRSDREWELVPCAVADGKVFAAPLDANRLIALDLYTGQPLWDRPNLDVVQMLGVARRRLIVTVGGTLPPGSGARQGVRGIRGVDIETGADGGPVGWTQTVDDPDPTFGRGIVTPDVILWPSAMTPPGGGGTTHGLQFLSPEDGRPLRAPVVGNYGNFAYANGILVVATQTEVRGYVSDRRRLGPIPPSEPPPRELGFRAAVEEGLDTGRFEDALALSPQVSPRARQQAAHLLRRAGDSTTALALLAGLPNPDHAVRPDWIPRRSGTPKPFRELTLPVPESAPDSFVRARGSLVRAGETVVPIPGTGRAVLVGGKVRVADKELLLPHAVTQSLSHRDIWLLVGPGGLTRLDPATGAVRWTFAAPAVARSALPSISGDDGPLPFSDFVLVSPLVLFRCGGQAWQAVDSETGTTAWVHYARSGHQLIGPGGPGVSPFLGLKPDHVLVQTSAGDVRSLEPATGKIEWVHEGPRRAWSVAPVATETGWLVPAGPGSVVHLDGRSGRAGPAWEAADEDDWTGEAPVLLPAGRGVLVAVSRNHAIELNYLFGAPVKPAWKFPVVIPNGCLGHLLGAADSQFFLAREDRLEARSCLDGAVAWTTPLPGAGPWRLAAVGPDTLLLHTITAEPGPVYSTQPGLFGPGLASYDAWDRAELPILLVDRATGRLRQRARVPAAGPRVSVAADAPGWAVTTARGNWLLSNP